MKSPCSPVLFAGAGRSDPLTVIYRRIEELKPDAANPRRHSKKQIRQIAASIEAFGFNVPILIPSPPVSRSDAVPADCPRRRCGQTS
jgi:ParB-like chromosome segregation protein Spo0J